MNSQLRKNLVFNTAGSLLFYVCQAAMNLLVTALAGAAANGLLATAMTIANVGLSFASYGMRTFQVSDEAGKYTDRTYLASRFVTVALAWAACMGFASSGVSRPFATGISVRPISVRMRRAV